VELETVLPDESRSMPVDVLVELAHAAEDLGMPRRGCPTMCCRQASSAASSAACTRRW
jgi:hypothetical protein